MNPTQQRVWDPLVRVFHWTLVSCFAIAYLTEGDQIILHTTAGYIIIGLVAVRLIWGLIGSRYARFSDFVKPPAQVVGYLKSLVAGHPARYLGHNPAGGAMIVLLLIMLIVTTVSGMVFYGAEQWAGPLGGLFHNVDDSTIHLMEEVHEVAANLTLALVVVHVLGVIVGSVVHRENLIGAMFTGHKPQ